MHRQSQNFNDRTNLHKEPASRNDCPKWYTSGLGGQMRNKVFTGAKMGKRCIDTFVRRPLASIAGQYPSKEAKGTCMQIDGEYEVFKGLPGAKAIRLGAVRGCERATQLMYRMYARLPGDYFVRDIATREVASSVRVQPAAQTTFGPAYFDIFRGWPDKNAVWVETLEGLAAARERMEEIAKALPARYFVFSRVDHSILAYTEGQTRDLPKAQTQTNSAA